MIGRRRRRLHPAPGVVPHGDLLRGTRRAHRAPLAGESDPEVVPALPTPRAGEAMGKDAALQLTAELPLDVGGYRVTVAIASVRARQVAICV